MAEQSLYERLGGVYAIAALATALRRRNSLRFCMAILPVQNVTHPPGCHIEVCCTTGYYAL